jgi:hypothetical protein
VPTHKKAPPKGRQFWGKIIVARLGWLEPRRIAVMGANSLPFSVTMPQVFPHKYESTMARRMMLIAITPLPGAVAPGIQDLPQPEGGSLISSPQLAQFNDGQNCQRLHEKPNSLGESSAIQS